MSLAAATVAPGQTRHDADARLFAGAKEKAWLDRYEQAGIPQFSYAIDWGWFHWFMIPIFDLLLFLFHTLGNFGLAIICLTFIVRAIMFPIAQKQFQSMAAMRKIQPKMKALQERFKDDKQRQQQEILKLYQAEKINPAAGCLPILLQIPVFYALYKTLLVSVEMRHQPFVLWIKDLSAPDPLTPINLFGLLHFAPPAMLAIGVLPILVGATQWMSMKLNPQPMDPAQAQMFAIMPWFLVFIMAPFAAGLQLYWITNNLLTIAQQWFLYRKFGLHLSRHASGPHMSDDGGPGARGARAEAVRRADRVPEVRAGAAVPARSRRAGDRLRRPVERRQELAAQRAHQPQGPGADVEHAGANAGAQLLRCRRARSSCGWSTCPATASPRRRRTWSSAGGILVNDYLRGRSVLKRALVLVDSRHGLKDVDREMMRMLDDAAVSYHLVLTKGDKVKPIGAWARSTKRRWSKRRSIPPRIRPSSRPRAKRVAASPSYGRRSSKPRRS